MGNVHEHNTIKLFLKHWNSNKQPARTTTFILNEVNLFWVFYEKSSTFIVLVIYISEFFLDTWFLKPSSQNCDSELRWDRSVVAAGHHWSPACGDHASVFDALSDEKFLRTQEFERASQCLIVVQLRQKQTETKNKSTTTTTKMLGDLPKARQWELLEKL